MRWCCVTACIYYHDLLYQEYLWTFLIRKFFGYIHAQVFLSTEELQTAISPVTAFPHLSLVSHVYWEKCVKKLR